MAKTLEERITELEGTEAKTRIKALETVAKRQARKKVKKLSGIIFPLPLCGCQVPDEKGTVFQAMVPCDGTIIVAIVKVDGEVTPDKPITMQAEVEIENDVYVRDFDMLKQRLEVELLLPALKGACIKVRVLSGVVEDLVWISLLFLPEVSNAVIKKIIMEDQHEGV